MEVKTEQYLSAKTCKNDDVVMFLDDGHEKEEKDKYTNKMVINYYFRVLVNDKDEYVYTPKGKSLKMLSDGLGKQTSKWIGRKFKVKIVSMEAYGQVRDLIRPEIIPIPSVIEEHI